MAWIASSQVAVVVRTDLNEDEWIDGLIDHAQGLAEVEVGTQTEPVPAKLQSVLTNIVARMWQGGHSAAINPAGVQQQMAGPYQMQDANAGVAGLGLTNREKSELRRAVGATGLWVQPTTRGGLETAPRHDRFDDETDPIDKLAGAQADSIQW